MLFVPVTSIWICKSSKAYNFADNKPAVVVTHGDELSLSERAIIRTRLGKLLGIPPIKQIFDIPGDTNWYVLFLHK